jgi:hypothetical protein
MHPTISNTLLSADNDFIYKSINGGLLWTPVAAVGGPIGEIEYDTQNPNLVYASDLFGSNMYLSSDGGDSWGFMDSSPGGPITDIESDPFDMGKIYVTLGSYGENQQLFKTENAGISWTNISNNLPNVPTNSVAISAYNNQELYVGNDLGVWVSLDGGENYESYSVGLPAAVVVEDLHFYAPDTTVRIGTYGRGYWRTDAVSKTYASTPTIESVEQTVFAYPNPSQNIFHLSKSIGQYAIYDQTGKQLAIQSDLEIDLTGYDNGIYLVRSQHHYLKLVKI